MIARTPLPPGHSSPVLTEDRIFLTAFEGEKLSLICLDRANGKALTAVVLSRHYVAANYVGLARLYAPQARLIFDTVDVHHLREQRAAELSGSAEQAAAGGDVVADYAVNVFNQHSAAEVFRLGARRIVLSVELTGGEMAQVAAPWGALGFEVFAYGHYVGNLLGSETGYMLGSSSAPGTPTNIRPRREQGREPPHAPSSEAGSSSSTGCITTGALIG